MKMVSTRNRFKFFEGEKVLCYEPDPTKAKVLYDSKVLEVCVSKEGRGRKIPEYLIHFSGWSTTWDRYVTEEFILKDNEENRILQCNLAEAAAAHLKSKKQKRKLSEILNNSAVSKRKLCSDVEVDDWKVGTESNTSHSAASSTATASEDENKEEDKVVVELSISNLLKKKLEEDYFSIKRDKKLVKLPCEPNVISILEGYVKTYAANALCGSTEKSKDIKNRERVERSISLCKEVMDGLRIYFDFTMPLLLLYNEEKLQFEDATKNYKPLSIYTDSPSKKAVIEINVEIDDSIVALDTVSTETQTAVPHVKSELPQVSPGSRHTKSHLVDSPASPVLAKSSPQKTPKPERLEELFGFAELEVPKRVLRSSGRISDMPLSPPPTEGSRMCSPRSDEEHSRRSGASKEGKCTKITRRQQYSPRQTATPTGNTRAGSSNRVLSPTTSNVALVADSSISSHHFLETSPHGRRVQPPPPLNLSSHISSSSSSRSGPSTPTATNPNSTCEVTNALNETMSWRMIPSYVYHQRPAPPSVIYGIQHLLRLFVKLPEMITRTNMPVHKLKTLSEHLELFLHYLDNQHEDFFHNLLYIETPKELKLSTSDSNLPSDSVIQR